MLSTILADVSLSSGNAGGIGSGLILLVIAVIVCGFAWWVINNYIPEPLRKYAILVLVLIGVIVIINFVAGLGGHAFIRW